MPGSGWHRKRTTPAELARRAKYNSPAHKQARARFTKLVAAGLARCWRCGVALRPGAWHVGHDDHQIDLIRGPECVPCNRRAAASKGAKVANAKRKTVRTTKTTPIAPKRANTFVRRDW